MQFTIKKSIYKTYKHIKLLFYNVLINLLRKFNKNVNSICLFFKSCNSNKDEVLARVGDKYLYKSDIKIDSFENDEDSILKIRNFIDNWARRNLLYQKALINLSDLKVKDLENLIENYTYDLYGSVYKETLLNKLLDTLTEIMEQYTSTMVPILEIRFILNMNLILKAQDMRFS